MKITLALFAVLPLLPTALLAAPLQATATKDFDPDDIDVADAIACRLDAPSYNGFALAVAGDDGVAVKRHWMAIKSDNPFMAEYDLPSPIVVGGRYSTRRIAFTASGIMAVLDMPDPAVIARSEHIDNIMDPDPMIDAIVASGKATRSQIDSEIKFRKFLGERTITDVTDPVDGDHWRARTVIAQNIYNVTTHPGKTLYGCSYRIELLDHNGRPL